MSSIRTRLAALGAIASLTSVTHAWAADAETVELPALAPIELHYSANGPSGVHINATAAMASLASTLQRASGYVYTVGQVDGRPGKQGAKAWVDFQRHAIALEYVTLHNKPSGEQGMKMQILIPVDVEDTGQQLTVRLTPPVRGSIVTESLWPFPYPHLPPTDRLVADYQQALGKLSAAEVHVKADAAGEIEAKYAPEAVFGNFMRLWGDRLSVGDRAFVAGRQYVFRYPVNGKDTHVVIAVFPYHEGSKVQYSATVVLAAHAGGSEVEASEMQQVRQAVEEVVNN